MKFQNFFVTPSWDCWRRSFIGFPETSHHLCGFKKASSFRAIVGWTPSWLDILTMSNICSFGLVVATGMPTAWATKYLWRKRTSFCERKSSSIIKFHIHNNQQTRPSSLTKTLQGSIHKSELLSGGWLLRNRFAIVAFNCDDESRCRRGLRDFEGLYPLRTFTTE